MHVDEMLAELSVSEWQEWMTFFSIEPEPTRRIEIALAQLTTLTGNLHGKPKDGGIFELGDFLPEWLSPEEQREREVRRVAARAKFEEDERYFEQAVADLKAKRAAKGAG